MNRTAKPIIRSKEWEGVVLAKYIVLLESHTRVYWSFYIERILNQMTSYN